MNKFNATGFYRHKDTLDIDIYVVRVIDEYELGATLVVKYWNRHLKTFQPDAEDSETVSINKQDYNKWKEVTASGFNL